MIQEKMKQLITNWANTLTTKDPSQMVALYANNAHLNATFHNETLTTLDGIKNYFVKFLQQEPVCKLTSMAHNPGSLIASGTYQFTTKDGSVLNARFTFGFNNEDKIEAHHSSVFPK
tara:strand:+ start:567 stop:917 length:351 start_codon:yes stop_codon:yes gene_type:complete